ncbi:nitrophenyl compound nitroreductase subunit ArsF family protein [bacterium]|nr:nitrophenyl compound nitroreductase subunit ArsF family protein [bacterium]
MTCNTIEQLARETAEKYKNIKFISVNIEEPQNEHFVRDFQLVSRSVVMERKGKIEKFDRVWELVRRPEDFKKYLDEGIERLSK